MTILLSFALRMMKVLMVTGVASVRTFFFLSPNNVLYTHQALHYSPDHLRTASRTLQNVPWKTDCTGCWNKIFWHARGTLEKRYVYMNINLWLSSSPDVIDMTCISAPCDVHLVRFWNSWFFLQPLVLPGLYRWYRVSQNNNDEGHGNDACSVTLCLNVGAARLRSRTGVVLKSSLPVKLSRGEL